MIKKCKVCGAEVDTKINIQLGKVGGHICNSCLFGKYWLDFLEQSLRCCVCEAHDGTERAMVNGVSRTVCKKCLDKIK